MANEFNEFALLKKIVIYFFEIAQQSGNLKKKIGN